MYVVVLRNGPLLGRCYCLTGPYLLFICPTCLVIALEPRRAQILPSAVAAPPGPRLCGLCELRCGPWGVALLLLHLLLVLTGGKEICCVPPAQAPMLLLLLPPPPFSPSCCLCCGCRCCLAFLVVLLL